METVKLLTTVVRFSKAIQIRLILKNKHTKLEHQWNKYQVQNLQYGLKKCKIKINCEHCCKKSFCQNHNYYITPLQQLDDIVQRRVFGFYMLCCRPTPTIHFN